MSKTPRFPRALRWCLYGLVFLLLAGAGGMWWAHRHLAKLIVGSFNRTSPGLEMTAKAAVLSGFDELALKSVRVRVRRDGSEVLRVPAATMRFSWRGLRAHFIREIVIEQRPQQFVPSSRPRMRWRPEQAVMHQQQIRLRSKEETVGAAGCRLPPLVAADAVVTPGKEALVDRERAVVRPQRRHHAVAGFVAVRSAVTSTDHAPTETGVDRFQA